MNNYGRYHYDVEMALYAELRKVERPRRPRRAVFRRIARLDEYLHRTVSNSR